jgi:hypothetical protein
MLDESDIYNSTGNYRTSSVSRMNRTLAKLPTFRLWTAFSSHHMYSLASEESPSQLRNGIHSVAGTDQKRLSYHTSFRSDNKIALTLLYILQATEYTTPGPSSGHREVTSPFPDKRNGSGSRM